MNKMIACCGLDCESCQARIATINDDDELREKVANEWTKLNKVLITKEMINCEGCRALGVKTPFCDKLCPIRKCVISKQIETCGNCLNLDKCDKIKMIITTNKDAYDRLKNNL